MLTHQRAQLEEVSNRLVRFIVRGNISREFYESLEDTAQAAIPEDLLAHRFTDVAGTEDEDVLRPDSLFVIAMRGVAPKPAGDAEEGGCEANQGNDDRSGNDRVVGHVHGAAQQQAGVDAGLDCPVKLVKHRLGLQATIEPVVPAERQKPRDEPKQIAKLQQDCRSAVEGLLQAAPI